MYGCFVGTSYVCMVALLNLAVFVWLICWISLCLYGCFFGSSCVCMVALLGPVCVWLFVGSSCVCMVALLDLAVFAWLLCWI